MDLCIKGYVNLVEASVVVILIGKDKVVLR